MSTKCTNCQKGITTLKFSDASVITSGKYRVPAVLITLVCPHCSQHYYTEVPAMEFILRGKTMKGMKLYNRSTIYNLALKTFGPEAQALKLMEEAAELAAAAARNMNGLGNEVDLAGELADVEIMIEQFRLNGMGLMIDFHKQKSWNALPNAWGDLCRRITKSCWRS